MNFPNRSFAVTLPFGTIRYSIRCFPRYFLTELSASNQIPAEESARVKFLMNRLMKPVHDFMDKDDRPLVAVVETPVAKSATVFFGDANDSTWFAMPWNYPGPFRHESLDIPHLKSLYAKFTN